LVSVARVTLVSVAESAAVAEKASNVRPVKRDADKIRGAFIFRGLK
jgi:hypothetical protein